MKTVKNPIQKIVLFALFIVFFVASQAQTNIPKKKFVQINAFGVASAIDVSPNGKLIVSGNTDGRLYFWDAENGYYIRTLSFHKDKISEVRFLTDNTIICASKDKKMSVYDFISNKEVFIERTSPGGELLSEVTALDVYGNELLTGHDNFIIRRWKFDKNIPKVDGLPLTGHTWKVSDIHYSETGNSFVSSCEGGKVIKWNGQAYAENVFEEHYNSVISADISRDGKFVASSGTDRKIILRNTTTNQKTVLTSDSNIVNIVRFTPDGESLVTGDNKGTLLIWNIKNHTSTNLGEFLNSKSNPLISIEDIAFTPSGDFIVFSCGNRSIYKVYLTNFKVISIFSKEIAAELDTCFAFKPKDQFERESQYRMRESKRTFYLDSLITLYTARYDSLMKHQFTQNDLDKNKSMHTVSLSIDKISNYFPEINQEFFILELKTKGIKGRTYEDVSGRVYIPLKEAKLFWEKELYKKAEIVGKAYLDPNDNLYKFMSINIKHPHPSLKDKVYDFKQSGEKIK